MPSKKTEPDIELESARKKSVVQVEVQDPLVQYRTKRCGSIEPLRKNQCTDIPCLLIFVIFMGIWVYVVTYAMIHGDDKRILSAIDSSGHRCGYDSNVLDAPNLFIFDLDKCINLHNILIGCRSPSICVSKCPDGRFTAEEGNCTDFTFPEYKNKLLCDKFVDKRMIKNCKDIKEMINTERCTKTYFPTKSLFSICLPFENADIDETWNKTLFAQSFRLPVLSGFKKVTNKAVNEIELEWKNIVGCIFLSLFICLMVICLLRWFAAPIIWLSVFGLLGVLLAGSTFSFIRYKTLVDKPSMETYSQTNVLNYIKQLLEKPNTWVWIGSILSIAFIVFLALVICIFSRIRLAIEIIKQGSRAVVSSICSMFFPIIPLILQCLTIAFVCYAYLNLNTLADQILKVKGMFGSNCTCTENSYKDGDNCTVENFNGNCTEKEGICQTARCALEEMDSWKIIGFKITNVIGGIWLVFFASAFNDMVLASVYSRWYWTYKKSKVPFCALCSAITRTFRYHLGTIAFGSLIITICRILRLMVEYLKTQCDKYPNPFTKAILWIFRCVFWCLERFMKFINRNAYIMCAIRGTNFCMSAKSAFTLLLENGIRYAALHTITGCLFFMCKLLISIGVTALVFIYVHDSRLWPSLIVGISTYVMSDLFFGVYSMANNTMFICALEDAKNNDGTEDHPYFMSRRLSKVLVEKKRVSVTK